MDLDPKVLGLDPDSGHAKFTFRVARLNELLEEQAQRDKQKVVGGDAIRAMFADVTKRLVAVSGLEWDDGQPISLAEVQGLDLDMDTMRAIVEGYYAAAGFKAADPEKKD